MTVERAKLVASIDSYLNDYPSVAERWRAGDPTVRAMMTSIIETVIWLSRDNDINIIEPFIKSKDRTIIADSINKGILPVATPCRYWIVIENNSDQTVSLSQGRIVEDGTGRQWRLLSSINIDQRQKKKALVEQSTLNIIKTSVAVSEPFYTVQVTATDDMFVAGISVANITTNTNYQYTPKFMNAGIDEPVFTLQSDDMTRISIIFGDSTRAGKTVQAGEEYEITITQCYGAIEPNSLSTASLLEITNSHEQKLNIYFAKDGAVRSGANPLSVEQLRLLASFPSMYDQNAVYMGNFDFLVRSHFMNRFDYMAVWNETIHEKYYEASIDNINHLNLTVSPKEPSTICEKWQLFKNIVDLIAKADSLYEGRVRLETVEERPYHITITGRLGAVHDMDTVRMQIKELLLQYYGKGSLSASHHNSDGFNLQEIATRMRDNIKAFQDRISDFSVNGEDLTDNPIKPHEWAFLTADSIDVQLTRTADTGTAIWTI